MFKWLNKQGVESDSGFVVQFTGRFTCEYREAGRTIEIEIESGFSGGRPSVGIRRDAFSRRNSVSPFHEISVEEQDRLLKNFKDAMDFQGLAVEIS